MAGCGGAGGGGGGNAEILRVWLAGGFEDCEALLLAYRGAPLAFLIRALSAGDDLRDRDALLGWLDTAHLLAHFLAHLLGDRLARLLWNIFTHVLLRATASVGRLGHIGTLLLIGGAALLNIYFIANIFLNIFTDILSNINALLSSLCLNCSLTNFLSDFFTLNFIYGSTELFWGRGTFLSFNIYTLSLFNSCALSVSNSVILSSALLFSSINTNLLLFSITFSLSIFIAQFSFFLIASLFIDLNTDLCLHSVALINILGAAHLLMHRAALLLISCGALLWSHHRGTHNHRGDSSCTLHYRGDRCRGEHIFVLCSSLGYNSWASMGLALTMSIGVPS